MELPFLLLLKGLGSFNEIKKTQESFRMVSLERQELPVLAVLGERKTARCETGAS